MPLTHPDTRPILLRRLSAYALDIVILFVVLAPLGYVIQRVLGLNPDTARGVYAALILNFSVPTWAYFVLADRSRSGTTIGKRLLSVRVKTQAAGRVGLWQALIRTLVKMVPWEVAHASLFLFAPSLGEFSVGSWVGLGASYALVFVFLVVAWRTRGHLSVHDLVASTVVSSSQV